jgi:hypothetical protein
VLVSPISRLCVTRVVLVEIVMVEVIVVLAVAIIKRVLHSIIHLVLLRHYIKR